MSVVSHNPTNSVSALNPELCLSKPVVSQRGCLVYKYFLKGGGQLHTKHWYVQQEETVISQGFVWLSQKHNLGTTSRPRKDFCPHQDPEKNGYKWCRVTAAAQMCIQLQIMLVSFLCHGIKCKQVCKVWRRQRLCSVRLRLQEGVSLVLHTAPS